MLIRLPGHWFLQATCASHIVATLAMYCTVYCDKSQDETLVLFVEFRMKWLFCTDSHVGCETGKPMKLRDPRPFKEFLGWSESLRVSIHKFELHAVIRIRGTISIVSPARSLVLSCICAMIWGFLVPSLNDFQVRRDVWCLGSFSITNELNLTPLCVQISYVCVYYV